MRGGENEGEMTERRGRVNHIWMRRTGEEEGKTMGRKTLT
jgi:hypothetical protein